jgi:hypothetical protein
VLDEAGEEHPCVMLDSLQQLFERYSRSIAP